MIFPFLYCTTDGSEVSHSISVIVMGVRSELRALTVGAATLLPTLIFSVFTEGRTSLMPPPLPLYDRISVDAATLVLEETRSSFMFVAGVPNSWAQKKP